MEYYLSFSYPDGHVEEIEETFSKLEKAIEAGKSLLNQILITEDMKKTGIESHRGKAFFLIYAIGETRELVYDSRKA